MSDRRSHRQYGQGDETSMHEHSERRGKFNPDFGKAVAACVLRDLFVTEYNGVFSIREKHGQQRMLVENVNFETAMKFIKSRLLVGGRN